MASCPSSAPSIIHISVLGGYMFGKGLFYFFPICHLAARLAFPQYRNFYRGIVLSFGYAYAYEER